MSVPPLLRIEVADTLCISVSPTRHYVLCLRASYMSARHGSTDEVVYGMLNTVVFMHDVVSRKTTMHPCIIGDVIQYVSVFVRSGVGFGTKPLT